MSFAAAPSTPEQSPDAVFAGMLSVLRALAAAFVAAFGDPAALIKGGAIYGKKRECALRWLHDMESVVRRLLLLRAAMFPAPAQRALHIRLAGKVRRRKEGEAETLFGPSDDPARWRVHFRMPAPPEPRLMQSASLGGHRAREDQYELGHRVDRTHSPATECLADLGRLIYWVDDPRPLAERLEALLRVIQDHEHYAAGLAQRLYFWRGREERRQIYLDALCAVAPIANEAGLPDAEWQKFADARPLTQSLLPVFSQPLRAPEPPAPAIPTPDTPAQCVAQTDISLTPSAPAAAPDIPAPPCAPLDAAPVAAPLEARRAPAIAGENPPEAWDDMSFDELVAEIEARMQGIRDST